jgi:asparagine synthase (glutamine-hydrolysing)
MSGIGGIFGSRLDDPRALGDRLAASLTYRDDAVDLWWTEGIVLVRAHHETSNRLPQPAVSPDRTRRLMFWGDLFNGDALRRGLRRAPRADDDADLVLAVLDERGWDALRELDGSFAFALHDARARELVLGNDRFSSRPLYYGRLPSGALVFGSQVRTAVQSGIARELDERAVRELFQYQRVHATRTLLRSVSMLAPGTLLRASSTGDTQQSWFVPEYRPETRSLPEWADALADGFRRSTARCLQRSRSAGVLLSGGLDSRMVVAASDRPLVCLHFNDAPNREFETARRVAGARGFEFRFLQRPPDHYAASHERGVDISDGLYGYHHSHHIGLVPPDSVDVVLHGYVPELFFRGTNLPKLDRTILGRRFWTADLESLQVLDRTINRDNVAAHLQRRLKYSLHAKGLHRFFRERWARDFDAQMLESANELVREARDRSAEPLDWFIWPDTRYHCKYPSWLFELAVRPYHAERSVVLHNHIVDLHLRMPVEMRADSRVWKQAVRRLNPAVAAVPDANTGRALFPTPGQLAREAAVRVGRRFGLAAPLSEPAHERPWHTDGSWPAFGPMLTHEPQLNALLMRTIDDPEAIDPEIFDVPRIRAAVDEHLRGLHDHRHFLMLLLGFGGWHRKYGPPGRAVSDGTPSSRRRVPTVHPA